MRWRRTAAGSKGQPVAVNQARQTQYWKAAVKPARAAAASSGGAVSQGLSSNIRRCRPSWTVPVRKKVGTTRQSIHCHKVKQGERDTHTHTHTHESDLRTEVHAIWSRPRPRKTIYSRLPHDRCMRKSWRQRV